MVTVGDPIARIEIASADVAVDMPATSVTTDTAPSASTSVAVAAPVRARSDGRVRATPLARRIARQKDIDIATVPGSGRRGRIEKADVLAAGPGGSAASAAGQVAGISHVALRRGRMAYLDSGKTAGDTVLLLHGFAGDRTTWAAVFSGLRRAGRRVLAPDLPGHGLTEIDARTPKDLSADLAEFLDATGADTVEIVAHSLGAVAAVDLASTHPGRVRALSLIAPAGLGSEIDDGFVHGMASASAGGEVAHLLRRISVNDVDLTEAALSALAAEMAKGRLTSLADAVVGPSGQRADSLLAIQKLVGSMKIRVLFGLEDRIIPWKHVLALPPRVAVHILARSGHMPQWDQMKDVLDILLAKGD
jgi:pyruvate dehydrogenase E2 component (dihydrolipoamide acetyltransferase)